MDYFQLIQLEDPNPAEHLQFINFTELPSDECRQIYGEFGESKYMQYHHFCATLQPNRGMCYVRINTLHKYGITLPF